MLKSFFSCPNVLLRLLVVLVFAGGLVFAATYDGFVVKAEAESCTCSGMDTASANKSIEQPEAEANGGCCGSATDTLLAETTTAQPEINHGTEEPTPAQAGACCSYNNTCPRNTTGCTNSCGPANKCTGSCKCTFSCCGDKKKSVCSTYKSCGGKSKCSSS